MNGIELRQYGTSLKESRRLSKALKDGMERLEAQMAPEPEEYRVPTWEELKGMGLPELWGGLMIDKATAEQFGLDWDLEEGWILGIKEAPETEPGWEIFEVGPGGEIKIPEAYLEPEQVAPYYSAEWPMPEVEMPELPEGKITFTAEEALEAGYEIPEGYSLEFEPTPRMETVPGAGMPAVFEAGYTMTLVSPEGWKTTQIGEMISPEGQRFTLKDLTEMEKWAEFGEKVEALVGSDKYGSRAPIFMAHLEEGDVPSFIAELIRDVGKERQGEVEGIFRMLKDISPEMAIKEEYFEKFWGYLERGELTPKKVGEYLYRKQQSFISQLGGKVGQCIEQYIILPWEMSMLELKAKAELLVGRNEELNRATLDKIRSIRDNYGIMASLAMPEFGDIYKDYVRQTKGLEWVGLEALPWVHPAWFIPIGSSIVLAGRLTSRIPLLGKSLQKTGAGVQAVERGIAKPIAKPVELGFKGMEKVGAKLERSIADRLIKEAKTLEKLMDLPTNEGLLDGVLVDNWMKSALTTIAKIPPARKAIEKGLGWRILTKRQGTAMEDIVGRGAVIHAEIARRGVGAKNIKYWELQAIVRDPIKYFGFNKKAYSSKMAKRLLPEYEAEAVKAGTLEHVLTRPEMYNWRRMQPGLEYITKVHEMNTEMLNLLKAEGVAPEHVSEDWWIHRVVEGKLDANEELIAVRGKPGVRGGRRIGAKPSYEMHRQAPTMADGIAWGIKYNRNPEVAVGSYIEEAYKKIADERFIKYVSESLEAIGKAGEKPTEMLRRFPELFEEITTKEGRVLASKAVLRAEELADTKHFSDVINRAIRGERLPASTLKALERRFPELGKKFKALAQEPIVAENQLREVLAQNERVIKELTAKLEKAEKIDVEALRAEGRLAIPDEQKLKDAFKVMDYEDRLAFRSTMDSQLSDIERMVAEQEMELAGIQEVLAADRVASYVGTWGQRRGSLVSMLTPEGKWPETLTQNQARLLMMGREIRPGVLTPKGRVRWEYVVDEIAEHFGMTEAELIKHLESIAAQKVTVKDLKVLVGVANDRTKAVKRMLKILDDVDVQPEFIPKTEPRLPEAEPGMPEPGMQQDMFGYARPVYPKGKGELTQIAMDDYVKLVELHEKAGLPPPDVAIKPKVEGIKGLEAETQTVKVKYDMPKAKTAVQRKAELEALQKEVKTLAEARKIPAREARAEQAFRMEQVRQPGIEEGYIMQPFGGGKIYDREFIDAFNKFFGHQPGIPGLTVTSDIAGILRITKAALDLSMMAIQGLPSWGLAHSYMLTNPVVGTKLMGRWYKAFFESSRAFLDPRVCASFVAKNRASSMQRIAYGGSSRAIDYFQTLQARAGVAGAAERVMGKIPFKPYHRAETAFFAGGEMVRDEFWRILSPKAIQRGQGFELARILDRITGIIDPASIGVPLTTRQIEQTFMWFAPSYTRACLTVVADIFRGGYTGAQTRRAIGGMIGAGAVMFTGIQYSTARAQGLSDEEAWRTVMEAFCIYEDPITGEWEWRPSGRFMTLNIGNYNFGFGGFWYGLLRLAGNVNATVAGVGEREFIDLFRILKDGSLNKKDNPFIYWWYSRSSALFGTGFEMASGKDFLGYPIEGSQEYARYIATRFEPIWMEQGINWMIPGFAREQEIPEDAARAAVIPAEIFGMRTFPESAWVKFYDKAKDYIQQIPEDELDPKQKDAWEEGRLEWRHLTEIQQMNLRNRHPDLDELYQKGIGDSLLRDSDDWKQWTGVKDELKDTYYKRGDNLIGQLQAGAMDTRELREQWSDAGRNYGIALDTLEKDPSFQDIYEYFEKRSEDQPEYGFMDDIALAEYERIMFAGFTDENGDMDWDAKDRAVADYIEKWGIEQYDKIREMYATKKEMEGLNPTLIRLAEDKDKLGREYWQLPWKPFIDMDEADVPAEYYALWKQYQALTTDAEREAFLGQHPDLGKDWRAEYRRNNPEADAMLALWGYGGKVQSMEAYNLVVQWGRELGIPLEQMGLGLPPQNLVQRYFDYNALSATGLDRKWFRQENAAFEEWGQETYGWTPIEEQSVMPRDIFALYGEYNKLDKGDLRLEFRYNNPEFEKWLVEEEGYTPLGDRGEPAPELPDELQKLIDKYWGLSSGTPRRLLRWENPELDAWLVAERGYKPIRDWWSGPSQETPPKPKEEPKTPPKAPKTPWEEAEEAKRIKEWIEKQ